MALVPIFGKVGGGASGGVDAFGSIKVIFQVNPLCVIDHILRVLTVDSFFYKSTQTYFFQKVESVDS